MTIEAIAKFDLTCDRNGWFHRAELTAKDGSQLFSLTETYGNVQDPDGIETKNYTGTLAEMQARLANLIDCSGAYVEETEL